jgi:hypothetical protein
MNNVICSLGGRRFLVTVGCGIATTMLCFLEKIDGSVYATVIISTVGVFIAGRTYQKSQEIGSKNEPNPLD